MKIYLGEKDGVSVYEELDDLGNLLLCGGPGGGKTVYLSRLYMELTSEYSPEEVKFLIYDDKRVDYYKLKDSPYLLFPITHDGLIDEFKIQLEKLKSIGEKRKDSNEDKTPIIVLIDEFCTLYYGSKGIAEEILYLANRSKDNDIHFFIATQRPNNLGPDILKGIPNRISYWQVTKEDSIDFIGAKDAENLKTRGEVLALINGKMEKLQQKPFGDKMYL